MSCTDPGTRSPGSMFLKYNYGGSITHTLALHLLAGEDPNNITLFAGIGQGLANVLGPACGAQIIFTDVGVKSPAGHTIWEQPLATAIVGTHAQNGQDTWVSQTLSFEGTGTAVGAGGCSGKTRFRLFIAGAQRFRQEVTKMPAAADATLLAILTFVNGNAHVGADYYGQKALLASLLPIQWNAATQRKYGA